VNGPFACHKRARAFDPTCYSGFRRSAVGPNPEAIDLERELPGSAGSGHSREGNRTAMVEPKTAIRCPAPYRPRTTHRAFAPCDLRSTATSVSFSHRSRVFAAALTLGGCSLRARRD